MRAVKAMVTVTSRATSTPAILFLLLALSAPGLARAQTTLTEEVDIESPQRFAFEARFGAYGPDVDESIGLNGAVLQPSCPGTQGPYSQVFGDDDRFYFEAEFDWQFYNIFIGTLAVGGSFGIFHATAEAFADESCDERSGDETGLWIFPTSLLLIARFDIFAERWSVPIVPYAKFGMTYAFWVATDNDGTAQSADTGESGVGGTFGLRLGLGVMLRLDWIERRAARTFDNEFGVNHSYLFFEWYWGWVDGFGQEGRMNVGDADGTWAVGLALEF